MVIKDMFEPYWLRMHDSLARYRRTMVENLPEDLLLDLQDEIAVFLEEAIGHFPHLRPRNILLFHMLVGSSLTDERVKQMEHLDFPEPYSISDFMIRLWEGKYSQEIKRRQQIHP